MNPNMTPEFRLAVAQAALDRHVPVARTGRCRVCTVLGPCEPWTRATEVFERYGRLPRRTPGLTIAAATTAPRESHRPARRRPDRHQTSGPPVPRCGRALD